MCSMQSLPADTTMEKMYSMNDTLSGHTNMHSPKKENMFHSVLNALNVLWGQFSKVPASFIASINYPLSVTVVNNEISHDFFKNLTGKREPLNTDNVYISNGEIKESLDVVESIHNDVFDEKKSYMCKIFNKNTKDNLKFSYEYIGIKNKDAERSDEKQSVIHKDVRCNTNNCNYLISLQNSNKTSEEELFEYICSDINTKEMSAMENCYNFEDTYSKDMSDKKQCFNCISNSVDDKIIINKENSCSTPSTNALNTQIVQQTAVPNLFTNMLQKVISSVTDRFCKTDLVESDLGPKRSFSPRQRRKLNIVAKGRGRGRAKSQLRRSGVSQTRHRKERTKHDIRVDIENDFKCWQELEEYDITEIQKTEESGNLYLGEATVDTVQYIIEETVSPLTYTFANVEPKIQKQKICRNINCGISRFSAKMRSILEYPEQTDTFDHNFVENRYDLQKNTFRPRLISESSIDSEDSYCIVFETGSEVTCKSDVEYSEDSEESDVDQTNEDEKIFKDEISVSPIQKVKFNLNPVIHIMVHWDYAYRAARKGPWEEMARDRERFRGRINSIERILSPILTVQHRTHIWHERFTLTE